MRIVDSFHPKGEVSTQRGQLHNPMWNFLGDDTFGPPGTLYYDRGGQVNYYWHMFDQVLIRPDLLKNYKAEDVRVLTEVGTVNLLSESGRPNDHEFSDHLPILLRLNISGDWGHD